MVDYQAVLIEYSLRRLYWFEIQNKSLSNLKKMILQKVSEIVQS